MYKIFVVSFHLMFRFQAHLLSVFDNTKSVKFHEKDYEKITAIVSKEEETIELDKPVMAQGKFHFHFMGA